MWLWLVLRWARSLQAEAEGHHTGRNATYKAEDGDAAWRGRSQSSRGWEDRGTTVSPWGARGGWEGKVSGRSLGLQDGTWEFSGDALAGKGLILR